MKSEWADYAAVQAECGNLYGNEFTGDLSGNIQQQSSQFAEPLWTDPGIKGGINGGEWMVKHSPKSRASEEKATTTSQIFYGILPCVYT